MDFGNGGEINSGKADFRLASGEETAGEARGLSVPKGAGELAVSNTVEVLTDLRKQILANAETDVEYTNQVFKIINAGRRKRSRFDITPAGEQRERLEDQLTDEALEAASQLFTTDKYPLMPVPPLPGAITAEELVFAINKSSMSGIYPWADRLALLEKFPINALTGYDEKRAVSGALTLVETGYDVSRQGTRDEQLRQLRAAREKFPGINTAPILVTASLAQRYYGQPNSWQDTYTRAIEIEPFSDDGTDIVPSAQVSGRSGCAQVSGRSRAEVCGTRLEDEEASRRQV